MSHAPQQKKPIVVIDRQNLVRIGEEKGRDQVPLQGDQVIEIDEEIQHGKKIRLVKKPFTQTPIEKDQTGQPQKHDKTRPTGACR